MDALAPLPLNQPLDLVAFADWDGIELPADLRETAAREINETEATRESGVCELLTRVAALPAAERPDGEEMSTRSLLCFLRARKFRVDQAFEMLCTFAAFKRDNPELFVDLHGEEFRALYAQGWQRVMRGRDARGRFIMTLVPAKMTRDTTLVRERPEIMLRFSIWATRVLSRNPYFQVLGTCIAETFADFSAWDQMKLSSAFSFGMMRKTFHFSQKCMAYRLGGIHVVNQPWSMSALWFLVKPFMSAKMKSRVHLLGDDLDALYAHAPRASLSADFGGTADEDPMWFLEQGIALEAAASARHVALEAAAQ